MDPRVNIILSPISRSAVKVFLFAGIVILASSCFRNPEPAELTTEIESYSQDELIVASSVISDGGSEIFQQGICWSNHSNPTLKEYFSIDLTGGQEFRTILPVAGESSFYFRSYAVNGAGISYGNEVTFSFVRLTPEMPFNITGNSATIRVTVASDGEILSRGVCWSTSVNPTVNDRKTSEGTGAGVFESNISGLLPGIAYHVRPYASNKEGLFYGEDLTFKTIGLPVVATKEIRNAGSFIPNSGGDILSNGDSQILNAGVCWSTSPSPTVNDSKTTDNLYYSTFNYVGFNSDLNGLEPGTTYYIRAYATNIAGTGYGAERVLTMPQAAVTDADGNHYSSVVIGSQEWTVENLHTKKYSNGDIIPNITVQDDWFNTTSGAWSYYENDPQYETPYGKLYNWFAVTDQRNVCPAGWHVPSESEFNILIEFLGGTDQAGGKLKEAGSVHWADTDPSITNSSLFTALPGGGRMGAYFGSYILKSNGLFYSTAEFNSDDAVSFSLFWNGTRITRSLNKKQYGFSVRCIRNTAGSY